MLSGSPGLDPAGEIFHAAFGRNGADLRIGRRLTELYGAAGLEDIGVEARQASTGPAIPAARSGST